MAIQKTFIENNPAQILQELISYYETLSGRAVMPAHPEHILIRTMAYREILLRSAMQRIVEGNFVQTASGSILNMWGELFNATRKEGESDDDYRARILAVTTTNARGSKYIYTEVIKALPSTADVQLYSSWTDSSIPPGVIVIVPLMKVVAVSNDTFGCPPTEDYKTAVRTAVQNEEIGIIGDEFVFENPTAVYIGGSITVKRSLARSEAEVRGDVDSITWDYFNRLSLSMSGRFDDVLLSNLLRQVEGVVSATLSITAPILDKKQYYRKGNITTNITT